MGEGGYTLYYTRHDRAEPDAPRLETRATLEGAVALAWETLLGGGRVFRIEGWGREVMTEAEMIAAAARMTSLEHRWPGLHREEYAWRALREMGKF
jgi:hypothetical protein